jgi:hypothetical protein
MRKNLASAEVDKRNADAADEATDYAKHNFDAIDADKGYETLGNQPPHAGEQRSRRPKPCCNAKVFPKTRLHAFRREDEVDYCKNDAGQGCEKKVPLP